MTVARASSAQNDADPDCGLEARATSRHPVQGAEDGVAAGEFDAGVHPGSKGAAAIPVFHVPLRKVTRHPRNRYALLGKVTRHLRHRHALLEKVTRYLRHRHMLLEKAARHFLSMQRHFEWGRVRNYKTRVLIWNMTPRIGLNSVLNPALLPAADAAAVPCRGAGQGWQPLVFDTTPQPCRPAGRGYRGSSRNEATPPRAVCPSAA